jgi:hypothetical protein
VRALALPLLLAACGGTRTSGPDQHTEPRPAAQEASPAVVEPRGEPLDEASARRLLAARFRAAGLRIVADVPLDLGGVTLVADGFDPARKVGYEYVATDERGIELDAGERARLPALVEVRLLIHDAASADDLERAADRFLTELPADQSPVRTR